MFRRFDIVIATFALTAGTVITALSYLKIKEIEQPRNVLFEGALPSGKSTAIISNQHGCIGYVTTELNRNKGLLSDSSGLLRRRTGDREIDLTVGVRAMFNPLGQMMEGQVTLLSDQVKLAIEARNVNPIKLQITAHVGELRHTVSSEMHGPITLQEYSPGMYRIEHHASVAVRPEMLKLSTGLLQNELQLTVDSYGGIPPGCRETRLNLNPLINRIQGFVSSPSLSEFSELLKGVTKHD